MIGRGILRLVNIFKQHILQGFFMKYIALLLCVFTSTMNISANTPHVEDHYGKKITALQMNTLNAQLTLHPMGTVRMKMSTKKIKEVLKQNEQKRASFANNKTTEKTFVHEQLATIIKPVQEFFDIIQNPIVIEIVKPIVAESLNNPKKSFILDFCNSKQDILSFCETEVVSCATLESICKELLHFFNSVQLSLSDKAKEAAKNLEAELKKQVADKKKP